MSGYVVVRLPAVAAEVPRITTPNRPELKMGI